MKRLMVRVLTAVALLAAGIGMLAASDPDKQTLRDALATGKPLVLAIIDAFPTPGTEGETYADWAYYLNEFAAAHENLSVIALDGQEAIHLLANPPCLDNHYATLFVRPSGHAVIYAGPIFEEMVYDAGVAYLHAPEDGEFDPEIFASFDFRLRQAPEMYPK